ncbi:hypothetical protein [uncultured Corynebacterium sp.]|uniref:hypothetical protein n=1 Tax=uncultured Corynebacterium sp. TaxID=159447 RepID=UPI00288C513C|nr:hypothetical protein [uncultured Corynebacterium sp.]
MPSPSRTHHPWWEDTLSRYSQMLNTQQPNRIRIGATAGIDPSGQTFIAPQRLIRDLNGTPAGEWVVARALCRHLQKPRTTTLERMIALVSMMTAVSGFLVLLAWAISPTNSSLGFIFAAIAVIFFFAATAIGRAASRKLREIKYHADLTATVTAGSDAAKDYFDRGGDQHRTLLHTYLLGELPAASLRHQLDLD